MKIMKKIIASILSAISFGTGIAIYTNNMIVGICINLGVYFFCMVLINE